MITKSRFLMWPSGSVPAKVWGGESGKPSTSAMASAIGSMVVGRSAMSVMGFASLPADDEPVNRPVGGLLEELIARRAAPRLEVLEGAGIRREDLDDGSGLCLLYTSPSP